MWLIVLIMAIALWNSPALVGGLFSLCAFQLFLAPYARFLPNPMHALNVFLFVMIVLAPVGVATVGGAFLDRFNLNSNIFRCLLVVASLALALGSTLPFEYLELSVAQNLGGLQSLALTVAILNSICFCGALFSFCIMFVCLVVELPFYWLNSAFELKARVPLSALRPVVTALLLFSAFDLVLGLCVVELKPASILRALHG